MLGFDIWIFGVPVPVFSWLGEPLPSADIVRVSIGVVYWYILLILIGDQLQEFYILRLIT